MAIGRTIARNSVLLALAHGSSKLFSIALTAVAARVLGPVGFGLYGTGAALVEVGRVIASSGLDFLVAREVASDAASASRVASNATAVKVITGLVTYFALIGLVIGLDYPPGVLGVVLVLGTALFFENVSDVVDAVFQGRERMQYTTRAFAVSSGFLFLSGTAALLGGLGLMGYVACFALSFVLRLMIMLGFARRQDVAEVGPSEIRRAEIVRMFRAGLPLFGATVLSLVFHRMDILMLGKMTAEAQVGFYVAATRFVDVVVLLPRILGTAVYPALRRSRDQDQRAALRLLAVSTRVTLLLCSLTGFALWIFAAWAVRLVVGEAFLPAVEPLRILSFGIVLQGGAHVLARLLLALDAERDFMTIAGASLVVNAALNLWWIPRLGIEGAAWATLCSYALSLVLYLVAAARRGYRLPLRVTVLGPLAGVVAAFAAVELSAGAATLRTGVGMVAAWLLLVLALRALRADDLATAWRMVRGGAHAGAVPDEGPAGEGHGGEGSDRTGGSHRDRI